MVASSLVEYDGVPCAAFKRAARIGRHLHRVRVGEIQRPRLIEVNRASSLVLSGGPKLAQARKAALETIGATADNRAANALAIILEIRKAGAANWRLLAGDGRNGLSIKLFQRLRKHIDGTQTIILAFFVGRGGSWEPAMTALSIFTHFHFPTWGEPTSSSLPTLRCDHCRKELGLPVHRYWRMRFCSSACMTAYQQRLGEITKMKIRRLDLVARYGGT